MVDFLTVTKKRRIQNSFMTNVDTFKSEFLYMRIFGIRKLALKSANIIRRVKYLALEFKNPLIVFPPGLDCAVTVSP